MTRVEALDWLEARKEHYELDDNCQQLAEALNMAIKALEQEPCEDAISRQAVDRLVWRYLKKGTDENIAFYEHFHDLPPVTPQPKTGHWIDDKCSVCGKGIEDLIDSREWYRNEEPKFCPFCGLKLVKPQESEGKE